MTSQFFLDGVQLRPEADFIRIEHDIARNAHNSMRNTPCMTGALPTAPAFFTKEADRG